MLEQNPPKRMFEMYIKKFSREDFALRSKLWLNSKFSDFQNLSVFSNFSAWNHIVCHRYRQEKVQNTYFNTLDPLWKSALNQTQLSGTSENESYIGHYCSWVHWSSKKALSHSPPSSKLTQDDSYWSRMQRWQDGEISCKSFLTQISASPSSLSWKVTLAISKSTEYSFNTESCTK